MEGMLCRAVICLQTAGLLCEFIVLSCDVLHLLSDRLNPDHDPEKHGEQLRIILVSLVATLLTFLLTLLGAGSFWVGLRTLAAKVADGAATIATFSRKSFGNSIRDAPMPEDEREDEL